MYSSIKHTVYKNFGRFLSNVPSICNLRDKHICVYCEYLLNIQSKRYMGEAPWVVHKSGAPGEDYLRWSIYKGVPGEEHLSKIAFF